MADPLSIIAGATGLADVCIRLASLLKNAKDDFQNTDHELIKLETHVATVKGTIDQVGELYQASVKCTVTANKQTESSYWCSTAENLKGCRNVIDQLEKLITAVVGEKKLHPKTYQFRKYLRLQSKEKDFARLQNNLLSCNNYLQTNLQAIACLYAADVAARIPSLGELQSGIKALRTLDQSTLRDSTIAPAESVLLPRSLNEHFYPPRAVSSLFTGRLEELEKLKGIVFTKSSSASPEQKRFVVYGPPGSGKTEFCCKFASDNKDKFWAVFHVVASSRDHVRQDFAQIAGYGKVDPNERAAKNWLSSAGDEHPWLLIVDNADDDSFPIHECYPAGRNGVILITSRIASMKDQGTGGERYFEFSGLSEESSCQLLLQAADCSQCSPTVREAAKEICTRLGHLPLALTHAGKTILEQSLRLEDYLGFFEDSLARIRRDKKETSKPDPHTLGANANIFASYDVIQRRLEQKSEVDQGSSDALDLLRIFAFFHHQRIRRDLLYRAAINPQLEREAEVQQIYEEESLAVHNPKPSVPWRQNLRKSLAKIVMDLIEQWNRPVLPKILSQAKSTSDANEVNYRVAAAMKELNRFSLVFHSAEDDSFSLHPAVHYWLRVGGDMTNGDQAIWCYVAATILVHAVLAPPLNNTNEAEIMRRDLVSHVASVRHHEKRIQGLFEDKQRARGKLWLCTTTGLNKQRATQIFKFSLVYMQGGQLKEAYQLQQELLDFLETRLGPEHEKTMNLKRLIAHNLWLLNKHEEAARMRKGILETSRRVRGALHPGTLIMTDEYGSAMWQQGEFAIALECHTEAVEGFKIVRGPDHSETLRAMSNLGRAYSRDWRFSEAVETSTAAKRGLEQELGYSHADTLNATDGLAMAYFDRVAFGRGQPGDLEEAIRLEEHVLKHRKEMLGGEHLLTLWANLNLARMKALRGDIDEALSDYNAGHEIAVRNLGESSHAVLFGQLHYARILTYAKRYDEAERVLENVTEHLNTGPPDRMLALFSLIMCRRALGKTADLPELVAELRRLVVGVFGDCHPAVDYIRDPRNGLVDSDDEFASIEASSGSVEAFGQNAQQMLARFGHVAVHSADA